MGFPFKIKMQRILLNTITCSILHEHIAYYRWLLVSWPNRGDCYTFGLVLAGFIQFSATSDSPGQWAANILLHLFSN